MGHLRFVLRWNMAIIAVGAVALVIAFGAFRVIESGSEWSPLGRVVLVADLPAFVMILARVVEWATAEKFARWRKTKNPAGTPSRAE